MHTELLPAEDCILLTSNYTFWGSPNRSLFKRRPNYDPLTQQVMQPTYTKHLFIIGNSQLKEHNQLIHVGINNH